MKYVFVILHYLVDSETRNCVDSILAMNFSEDFAVVVVDNHSANGSTERLQSSFMDHKMIHLITTGQNLGFAQGNNAGIAYARDILQADFVILINNDTIIRQPQFLNLIDKTYETEQFHILGPDILSIKTGLHQNPISEQGISIQAIDQKLRFIRRERVLIQTKILPIVTVASKIIRSVLKSAQDPAANRSQDAKESKLKSQKNPVLHGSALIFSPLFLTRYIGLYPGTFMYYEEEILHWYGMQNQLKMVYQPAIQIDHLEDASTNALRKTNRAKTLFKLSQEIKSLQLLKAMHLDPEQYRSQLNLRKQFSGVEHVIE